MKIKNPYPEGDPNYEIFMQGVAAERVRLEKIILSYHQMFSTGKIEESTAMMEIRNMYDFIVEKRQV
jgi:hypothetical protein